MTEGWHVGRSRNIYVNNIFKHLHRDLQTRNLHLQLSYVPSKDNPADLPSRGIFLFGPPLLDFSLPRNLENELVRCYTPFHKSTRPHLRPLSSTKLLPGFDYNYLFTDC